MARVKAKIVCPRVVLGARSLGGISRASRDRMLDMTARTHEPEALAVTLSKAIGAGAEAVLVAPSPQLRAALTELRRPLPLLVIVPSVDWRDAVEMPPGLSSRIAHARRHASMGGRMRARFGSLMRLPAVMRGDWSALLPALIELEVSRLERGELAGVVLDAGLADLALAAGNAPLFERYAEFVRRRFAVPAGIETHNLGAMLTRLEEWKSAPDFVVGPMNPAGLGMKPSAAETVAVVARSPLAVLATELRAGGRFTLAEGAAFARANGARGLAPDLVELEDVPAELKELAAAPVI
jgi:hypothetical protein